ncbi:MAG: protein kinase [Polyangiaceae bacterium]|nr:protein kinase [Polyangiaceae bacterium]
MQAPQEALDNSIPSRTEGSGPHSLASAELPLPRRLGRLLLLKQLARGGMGDVFLAVSGAIDGAERLCVVKTIRRDHADDESFLARFLDEARIQSQLQHPGVAQVLEAATDEVGKPYVVVEFVEGRNLAELRVRAAQTNARLNWEDAVAVAIGMAEGLAYIHECRDANGKPLDIVHRDLSPQNVMVGYAGDVKLIDFGTARAENRRCRTVAGVVFAKPGYVAPEVANNTPGGIPADIYALGVMLWELMAGRRFLYGDPAQHLAAVGAGKRSPARLEKIANCPAELDNIIAKLTATLIEQRYSSARAAVQDLTHLLAVHGNPVLDDSSTRARIRRVMAQLFPGEPQKTRAEFAELLSLAKSIELAPATRPPAPAEPTASALLPGTRYRLATELGRGSSSVVYEAYHVDLDRVFALKLLSLEACEDVEAKEGLRAEAKLIFGVEHPNLVKVHDFGFCSNGRPFFVMERLRGETLDKYLERKRGMDFREVCALGIQALTALEAAHERGLVHRDIKLQNLFLTDTGTLKLLDFGVAKNKNEVKDAEEGTLAVVGTPETMSPEQARGKAGDARSDLYSLGAVLYELVTGFPTHQAESMAALLRAKCCKDAPPIRQRAPGRGLPRSLEKVLARALERHPEMRFGNARAFREELVAVLSHSQRSARRLRTSMWAGAACLVSVTALAAVQRMHPEWLAAGMARIQPVVVDKFWAHAKDVGARLTGHRLTTKPSLAATKRAQVMHDLTENTALRPLLRLSEPQAMVDPTASPREGEVAEMSAGAAVQPQAGKLSSKVEPAFVESAAEAVDDDEVAVQVAQIQTKLERGKSVTALHSARALAKQYPKDPRSLRLWSEVAAKSKAWGEALKAARAWEKIDSSAEAARNLIRMLRSTGHAEEAARRALLLGDTPTFAMLD